MTAELVADFMTLSAGFFTGLLMGGGVMLWYVRRQMNSMLDMELDLENLDLENMEEGFLDD